MSRRARRFPRLADRRMGRLLAALLFLLVATAPDGAAVITFNDFADYDFSSPPSNVSSDDPTGCTLREAIANANSDAQTFNDCPAGSGADEIRFSGAGTVVLGNLGSPLFVNGDLTLRGPATIDGSNEGDILRVTNGGVDLVLEQMTFERGSNGAISIFTSTGSLRINQGKFENNSDDGNVGGAIDGASPIQLEADAAGGGLADSIALSGTGFAPAPGLDVTPNGGLAFGNQLTGTTRCPSSPPSPTPATSSSPVSRRALAGPSRSPLAGPAARRWPGGELHPSP